MNDARHQLPISLAEDTLLLGTHLQVRFERTLRIPDDGGTYPLPPGMGCFPLRRVEDYLGRAPESWRRRGGVFLPMYQREAMWLSFDAEWPPVALKVGVGDVNAISGRSWDDRLDGKEQDYVVCPDQPWLDGINAGHSKIRQFVAMPLRLGYTVEEQVVKHEPVGGLQLLAFDARPDRLPKRRGRLHTQALYCCDADASMGLAAGGQMEQEIYPDECGVEVWDTARTGRVFVHIANGLAWREITGENLPPTPVSPHTYTECGLPWFTLYDEGRGDLDPSGTLAGVKGIGALDEERGLTPPLEIPKPQVVELRRGLPQ